MNPFFKVYCRIYQAAFHAALPVLPYREPEIFHSIAGLELPPCGRLELSHDLRKN